MYSFISASPSSTNALRGALSAINNVLSKSLTQKLDLSQLIVTNLLPILTRQWTVRSSAVRDQILGALLLGIRALTPTFLRENAEDLSVSIENLLDTFRDEYGRRKERDLLLTDDLNFFDHKENGPLSLTYFGPRVNSGISLGKCLFMSTSASLVVCSDYLIRVTEDEGGASGNPEKRQRLTRPLEDIIRQACSPQGSDRLFCLQIVPWLLSISEKAREEFADHIDHFLACMNDDDAHIASWSTIGMAWYVFEAYFFHEKLNL